MDNEADFITRLIGFGLSEKEAIVYLHLLKYGPKTPSPLAKSLKTYREDVHRTLNSLIDKGMVKPSLDSPTVYAAVDLDTALESVVKKQESELREMEVRKRELKELAKQQHFRPSEEVSTFKIIKNIKELVAVALPLIESMTDEWLVAAPAAATIVSFLFGINEAAKEFIERGGKVKAVIDISYETIEPVREMMSIGEEVHHIDQHGVTFAIFDRKVAFSVINADVSRISLSQPLAVLWTDDPTYAQYLASTFDMLWKQSTDAEERIQQLLKEGPPHA
jgi:sugar-specific transcriptional regulator TrmB